MPRPSWSPEKIALLRTFWTTRKPLKVIMQRLDFKSEQQVYSKVQSFRKQGYDFPRRYRGGGTDKPGNFGVVDGGLCIPTTPGHVIQAARIMDAEGRVVATLDPKTRIRKAL